MINNSQRDTGQGQMNASNHRTTYHSIFARTLLFSSLLLWGLNSCSAANFIGIEMQGVQVRRLRRWIIADEYRRLSRTEAGKAMIQGSGQTVTFDLNEAYSLDRQTKGGRVDAWLVPAGPDWMVLREMAARGREELLESGGIKIVRVGQLEQGGRRLSFARMPDGVFDLVIRFPRGSSPEKRLVVVHAIMRIENGSSEIDALRILSPDKLSASLEEMGATESGE